MISPIILFQRGERRLVFVEVTFQSISTDISVSEYFLFSSPYD